MLIETLNNIRPIDEVNGKKVNSYLGTITRESESLGSLQNVIVQIAKITSRPFSLVTPPGILLFAADHGVHTQAEEVAFHSNKEFLNDVLTGGSPICALANQFGAKLNVVDIGVAANFNYEQLIDRKIRYGTANFYQEDAMTRKEAIQAIEVGIEVTEQLINRGIRCLVLSNVGMANAACLDIIYSIVTGNSVLGNDYVDLIDKRRVNAEDPVDILAKVGGLEIAGMIGAILKAAERRIPILVDGPASLIAVLLAYKLSKHSISYILIGQKNLDPISVGVTELLEQRPLVDLGVQLFDGTGALLAYPLIHSALTILIDTISKENF